MASAFRYALFVWLLVSAIALIVQLMRRRRYNQEHADQVAEGNLVLNEAQPTEGPESEAQHESALADLLDGIEYPRSLRPLVPEGSSGIENHQCLITSESSPDEVGQALTEEFEKKGYEVVGTSESEALAKRSDGSLTLSIVAEASEASVAGVRRFPSARKGDIVVEIWKGDGKNPALA